MKVQAQLKNARMTPRKVRELRSVVMDLPASEALAQLQWQPGKAAGIVRKLVSSAVANADHNHEIKEDNLKVASLRVDEGISFRRFQPVSRGSAHPFRKRTANVTVVLEEIDPSKSAGRKKQKAEIDTLTIEELATREQEPEEVEKTDEVDTSVTDQSQQRDESMSSFQKTKMQQQGGDKKKTHRRKSM